MGGWLHPPLHERRCNQQQPLTSPLFLFPASLLGHEQGTKVNSRGKEVPHGVRLYSIAASRYGDNFDGQTTSLCVRRATYWDPEMNADDPAKKGICSNFLCDAAPGAWPPGPWRAYCGAVGVEEAPAQRHSSASAPAPPPHTHTPALEPPLARARAHLDAHLQRHPRPLAARTCRH